jgi:hypothetical protein
MKRILAMLLAMLVIAIPLTVSAQTQPTRADAAFGVRYAEEQVVQLPQDQGKWYLSLFGNEGETKYETLKSWFSTDAPLQGIRTQAHYNTYRADSTMFAERYAASTTVPCVRLQDSSGKVVFQAVGDAIPMSPQALYNSMNDACRRRCRPCPQPQPTPQPQPQPPVNPVKPSPQPTPPAISDFPSTGMWSLMIALGLLVGSGAGLAKRLKEEFGAK